MSGRPQKQGKKMQILCRRSWMLCIKGGWESEKALCFIWWKSLVKQMQCRREYRLQLRSDMKGPTHLPCEHIQKARWKHFRDGSSRRSTVSNLIRSRWISNWWMFSELSVSNCWRLYELVTLLPLCTEYNVTFPSHLLVLLPCKSLLWGS